MSGRQAFFVEILESIDMSILKAFVGGLVGAVIATVVLMVLRDGSLRGYEWFPLVTGLLTGLGARLLAGSMRWSLTTGIVAAVVSMAAILLSDDLIELMKMRSSNLGILATVVQRESIATQKVEAAANEHENGESADDSTDIGAVAAGNSEKAAARSGIVSGVAANNRLLDIRPKKLKDYLPYIFSGLGVLIAYNVGRSTLPAKVVSEDPAPSTSVVEAVI